MSQQQPYQQNQNQGQWLDPKNLQLQQQLNPNVQFQALQQNNQFQNQQMLDQMQQFAQQIPQLQNDGQQPNTAQNGWSPVKQVNPGVGQISGGPINPNMGMMPGIGSMPGFGNMPQLGAMPGIGAPMQGMMPMPGMTLPGMTLPGMGQMPAQGGNMNPQMQFQFGGFQPFASTSAQQANNNNKKEKEFKAKEQEYQGTIQSLEYDLEQLNGKHKKLEQKYQNQLLASDSEKQELESKIIELTADISKYKKQLSSQNNQLEEVRQKLFCLEEEKSEVEQNYQKYQQQNKKNQAQQSNLQPIGLQSIAADDFLTQQKIQKQLKQIQTLEQELVQQKAQISDLQDQLQQANEKVDKEHNYFLNAKDEIVNKNKEITNLKKKITDLVTSQEATQKLIRQLNNQVNQHKLDNNELQYQNELLQQQVEQLEAGNKKLRELMGRKDKINDDQVQKELQKVQESLGKMHSDKNQKLQELHKQNEMNKQELNQKMEKEKQLLEDRKNKQKQQEADLKAQRMGQLGGLMNNAKKEQGQLDVCFLVDVTGSMDPYKEQTRQSVMGALKIIKQSVNRETNWAAICYQDKAEKKKLGKYHEFPFSNDQNALQTWFDKITCSGGGDFPEDIQGAIEQMNQLKWPSKFRIAILICDAPCHGKKYHDYDDSFPNDDIRNALEKMIDLNIIFIGLNFTKYTTKMYDEFKKIFAAKKKEEALLYQDLQKVDQAQLSQIMVKYLGEASQNATHTNKRQTKSKNENQNQVERNKDGAMESLCKLGNFYNFETQKDVKCVDTTFQVIRVEIKQDSFDKNIQTIEKIVVPYDYNIIKEGTWNCIRTEKPFAFGMMKDVFLMKKKDSIQQELYVIKTPIGSEPYKTFNDALSECRSHLICQKLMKRFQEEIAFKMEEKNINKKYPAIVYSDFLILQESANSFWIAERFFKGEFVKYNNNFGFIESDVNDFNKMAQAFSFYTYFSSGFNYMVSDVQGVGIYFTDPAINTIKGNFDDTDMGLEGQQMYLVAYEIKKDFLSKEILEILDIYE